MNNLSNELVPNERLKEIQEDGFLKHGESKLLAGELLAYREAQGKPIAHIFQHPAGKLFWAISDDSNAGTDGVIPVYAAPQFSTTNQKPKSELLQRAERLAAKTTELAYRISSAPVIPSNWVLVPIKPTEDMIIEGFESEPDETFSEEKIWEAYQAMSGCEQAAYRVRLCWAAMLAVAPKQGNS